MNVFLAEFFGTMLLILLGNGVVANVVLKNTKGHNAGWIVITTAWALAVFVGVVVAALYSGAHINPAVTVGLLVAGKLGGSDALLYIGAQMLGAMTGALLVWLLYRQHFAATDDNATKLSAFSTGPAMRSTGNNLFSEALGTFVLMFVIFYVSSPVIGDENNTPIGMGSLGALPVALLVWGIGLSLGGTTGYAINPARDLGPRIMHAIIFPKADSDWKYSWIPVIGPLIGASLASMLYIIISQ